MPYACQTLDIVSFYFPNLLEEKTLKTPWQEWHKNILAGRKEKIQSGKATFITLKELKTDQGSGALSEKLACHARTL